MLDIYATHDSTDFVYKRMAEVLGQLSRNLERQFKFVITHRLGKTECVAELADGGCS